MPARTIPRRSAAPARGQGHGRFARPMPVHRPAPRGRTVRRKQPQRGGPFASALRALPGGWGQAKKRRGRSSSSSSSKAGPALGILMAGAGALLGRRQMKRRRAQDTLEHPTPV